MTLTHGQHGERFLCGDKGRKEGNVLFNNALNTFSYGYMASDIWLRTILIVRNETRCHHMGYSFRLAARVLLYAQSHRQDNTYHGLCYTSRGTLAGTRNSVGDKVQILQIHLTGNESNFNSASPARDRSDNPSHHEWMPYHRATSCSFTGR